MAVWTTVQLADLPGAFRMDAQFWQPTHTKIERALRSFPCEPLGNLVNTLRKGVFDLLASDYVEAGVPYYRSANVGEIIPNDNNLVYITEARDAVERNTSLKQGDIMIAKTGNEAASVVLCPRCNVSQDVIAVRVRRDRINPFYLAVFLNTSAGFSQMQRWFQGQSQLHLSLPDTRRILIPLIAIEDQKRIEKMVIEAKALGEAATAHYADALGALTETVGLDSVDMMPRAAYGARYSDAVEADRLDPQFFQPRFGALMARLEAFGSRALGSLVSEPIFKGVTPEYVEDGGTLLINSQHLGRSLLDTSRVDRTSHSFWVANPRARLRVKDVLVYATGAYVGRTNVLLDEAEAVAGLHVLVVRTDSAQLDPLYAAVMLNSTIGLMQSDRWATGSAQRDLYPKHLEQFLIPNLEHAIQARIAASVRKAHGAQADAARLLDGAKNVAEGIIFSGRTAHGK